MLYLGIDQHKSQLTVNVRGGACQHLQRFWGLKNVNRRFCITSVKMGGMQACREAFAWNFYPGVNVMDEKVEVLKEKLDRLMREAAETAADLQAAERGTRGPVHFSQIEAAAHEVGSQLSCRIQERAAREVAADSAEKAPCPACGTSCRLSIQRRTINSTDGPIVVWEPQGHCTRCRRDFFPSA